MSHTQTFVTHLECSATGKRYEADRVHGLSEAGKPLLVRYDLDALAKAVSKETLATRQEGGFWRYAEFLPVRRAENRVALGEVMTPLVPLPRFGAKLSAKDEGRLPTGSFKARGLALAVAMAKELGLRHLAMPTNGNAGAALAAYASRAGIRTTVFCPADTPEINVREIALQGADVYRVNGLINDCGKIVGQGKDKVGWFDTSTLKEPYRIEGKKTMGIELAEQLGWRLPKAIFYPTGGGTGLIGMWKAFHELRAIGWLTGEMPKMIAVQASGCAPIVKAWQDGVDHAELWQDAHTVAAGIRVPAAIGDFLILDAVRQSGGWATAVPDEAIVDARDRVAREEGMLLCPEGAATFAAWEKAVADGLLSADDEAVLFNCATGLKYPMPDKAGSVDKDGTVDFAAMA
ncbi:threonine synthase [Ferruginivarius sediminum]|uniref:Threonine synthase n=1 Tax=Ferruginivarius sediminum TaxID=2661937 RepID=A0A369T9C0_9PROT|nr:threonine synthase [Ferruginivarius sediminum]RDD61878.1 threonine synthase [Ferruginivarius sediminum]